MLRLLNKYFQTSAAWSLHLLMFYRFSRCRKVVKALIHRLSYKYCRFWNFSWCKIGQQCPCLEITVGQPRNRLGAFQKLSLSKQIRCIKPNRWNHEVMNNSTFMTLSVHHKMALLTSDFIIFIDLAIEFPFESLFAKVPIISSGDFNYFFMSINCSTLY